MAEIVPTGVEARVRNLQVHGKDVDDRLRRPAGGGEPGGGPQKADLTRGDTIAKPGSVKVVPDAGCAAAGRCKNSQRTDRSTTPRSTSTTAPLCVLPRWCCWTGTPLQPGESCYAQLRLTEELAAKAGDRFVVRFFSPLETIGGGVVLDACPRQATSATTRTVLEALSGQGERLRRREASAQARGRCGRSLPDPQKLLQLTAGAEELSTGSCESSCGRRLGSLEPLPRPVPGRPAGVGRACGHRSAGRSVWQKYHQAQSPPARACARRRSCARSCFKGHGPGRQRRPAGCPAAGGRKIKPVADRYALADFESPSDQAAEQPSGTQLLAHLPDRRGLETATMDEVLGQLPPNERD